MKIEFFDIKMSKPKCWDLDEFKKVTKTGIFTVTDHFIYENMRQEDKSYKYIYEGKVINGLMEGKGKVIYPSGDIFEGEFKDDKKEGEGVYYKYGSYKSEGVWKNGKKHGFFRVIFPDGCVHEVNYMNGEFHGICKGVTEWGVEFEFEYDNGEVKRLKSRRKIKKDDFKMDMQYLTDLMGKKEKYNEDPFYELEFEGIGDKCGNPIKGTLSIKDVFLLDAEWHNAKLMRKSTLYDALNKTHKELYYAFGVRLNIEEGMT